MNEIRRERNKELFIDTACEIVRTEGIEVATIRNIANKANYNSATLYSYFKNLSHLILYVQLKFEREIAQKMKEYIENSNDKDFEIWPKMYIVMAEYYMDNPNAFDCAYMYKNENGSEQEIRELRKEQSALESLSIESFQRIAKEENFAMEEVLKIHQTCISLMVGTLLLVIKGRINLEPQFVLNEMEDKIRVIINTLKPNL